MILVACVNLSGLCMDPENGVKMVQSLPAREDEHDGGVSRNGGAYGPSTFPFHS